MEENNNPENLTSSPAASVPASPMAAPTPAATTPTPATPTAAPTPAATIPTPATPTAAPTPAATTPTPASPTAAPTPAATIPTPASPMAAPTPATTTSSLAVPAETTPIPASPAISTPAMPAAVSTEEDSSIGNLVKEIEEEVHNSILTDLGHNNLPKDISEKIFKATTELRNEVLEAQTSYVEKIIELLEKEGHKVDT